MLELLWSPALPTDLAAANTMVESGSWTMSASIMQSAWVEQIGWVLIHSLWQFILLAVLAILLQWTLRRQTATARYRALLTTMLILAATPVVTWFSLQPADVPAVAAQSLPVATTESLPVSHHADNPMPMADPPAALPEEVVARPQAEPLRSEPVPTDVTSWWSTAKQRIQPWLAQIVMAWFAGVFVVALRPLLSWYTVRRLRTTGVSPAGDALQNAVDHIMRKLRLTRAVDVLQSALVKMPVVVGYFRPAILLPLCVVAELPMAQLELILAHELAHIRRHDYLVNLLQMLVETLFFYHPAVWWLSRQIRNERENCCDDMAMATVGSRADYGRALLAIEELRTSSTALSVAAGGGSLLARIRRIAACEPAPRVVGGGSIFGLIVISLALLAAATWNAAPAVEDDGQHEPTETVVSGQIVDSAGKPIPNAQVAVMARSRGPWIFIESANQSTLLGSTKAAGDGHFRLTVPKVSSAAYFNAHVVAAADGFNFGGQEIGLDIEQPNATISLTAEQTIRGQVVDTNNEPVANAEIRVREIGFGSPASWIRCDDASSQPLFWPKPVKTDRQGYFTLRGVDCNRAVHVQVDDERFAFTDYWIAPVDEVSKWDNVRNRVRVSSSGDVTLALPPSRICEGSITYGDTRQPVANARVAIHAGYDGPGGVAMTDAAGHFRLNLQLGKTFDITVYPPDGEPYLISQKRIELADGEQPPKIAIALPRGVLLQGKVVEDDSGRPITGATIQFDEYPRSSRYAPERTLLVNHTPLSACVATKTDGTFAIAAPPGFGLLLIRGPGGDFIRQEVAPADFQINWGDLSRHHVSAFVPLDLKIDQAPAALNVAIRRGVTIRGRIVGPDNRPVDNVRMASRHFLGFNNYHESPIRVKDGQFELHGLDPEVAVPFYFLDAKNELGATVEISGKSADAAPLVVHLQSCGKAVARFIDPEGKPQAKQSPCATFVISPDRIGAAGKHSREVFGNVEFMAYMDPEHHGHNQLTDDNGKCTFPTLIPGATYQFGILGKCRDSDDEYFAIQSGETLQLPDIVVRDPDVQSQPVATSEKTTASPDKPSADTNAWQPGQTLDFRVINAKTKEPMPDVKLKTDFSSGEGSSFRDVEGDQTTDAEGRAEITLPDWKPDQVCVYPSKAGFVPLRVSWGSTPAPPVIPKSVTVSLEPGTVWGGIVQNEKGEPVPDVKVTVHYRGDGLEYNPHLRASINEETTTDKDGRWRIDVMPAEVVEDQPRIFLSHPDYVSDYLDQGIPMPVTERPATEALREQTAVMIMRKGLAIRGRIVDQNGKPVAGAVLYDKKRYIMDKPGTPAATSDENGRFQIPNATVEDSAAERRRRIRLLYDNSAKGSLAVHAQKTLAIQAPGYTPEIVVADLSVPDKPLEITLKPGRAIQGRVIDESGKPVGGVSIWIESWQQHLSRICLTAVTDADGRFRLIDVPLGDATYHFHKDGYMMVDGFAMSPASTEQPDKQDYVVTLGRPLQIVGSIVDAETNKPVAKCRVIEGGDYNDGRAPEWHEWTTKTITGGQYEMEFRQTLGCYRVRVEADGYMPAISRIFKPGEPDRGRVTCDFKLSKAAPLTGTVLGLDESPLANAEVVLATNPLSVKNRKASSDSLRDNRMVQTDAAGRFELPPEVEPFCIVVLHDQGFANMTEQEFADSSTIRIQPWTAGKDTFQVQRRPVTARAKPAASPKLAVSKAPSAQDEKSSSKDDIPAANPSTDAWQPGQVLDFRVINARTKEPLPDVKLDLQFSGKGINFQDIKVQRTDAEGRSEIRLPEGEPHLMRVHVSEVGFTSLRLGWEDATSPAFPNTFTVPLEPGTAIGGEIRDEMGEPVPDATVTVQYWGRGTGENPSVCAFLVDTAITDRKGRWRLDVMPAEIDDVERLRIFLSHPDYVSDHLGREAIYTYMQQAHLFTPITERPSLDALRKQSAVMIMRKGTTIVGRVTDESGNPISGALICNQYDCYDPNPLKITATTDKEGHFRLSGLSHRQNYRDYFFTVQAAGHAPVFVEISDHDSAKPAEIELKRGQAIRGRVVDDNGKPLEGVSIKLDYWMGRPRQFHLQTTTDADGKFRIDDAPSERAEYNFEKDGYATIQHFEMMPSLSDQQGTSDFVVTMRSPLWVAGSIVDAETNQLLAKCTVTEGWDFEDGRSPEWETSLGLPAKVVTDGRYEFEFTRQGLGSSRIRVEAEGYMPTVSRGFTPGGPDKGRVTYDFRMTKAVPISGTVLGLDGKPLADAEVFLAKQQFSVENRTAGPNARRTSVMAKTDANGRFEFSPEVEPFYLVVLHDQGHIVLDEKQFAETPTVHIKPWTTQDQTFTVERKPPGNTEKSVPASEAQTLAVRIVDSDGKPVEGANVARSAEFRAAYNYLGPNEPAWRYFRNVVSDGNGMARIPDKQDINCIVARHVERKLVAIQSISKEQLQGTDVITLTMQPQCKVFGKLTAKELESCHRTITWSRVSVDLGSGFTRAMDCMSNKADFHFYLPPGTYTLDADATDTQPVRVPITVKPGQAELEVEPIDLPPTALVLLEGKPAPELRDVVAWKNGGPVKLSDMKGKVVILAFSRRWVADRPHDWMPNLFTISDKYRDQGLAIIDVRLDMGNGIDSQAKLDEKIAEVKSPFWDDRDLPIPIALGLRNRPPFLKNAEEKETNGYSPCAILKDYGINSFPSGVLIDRQGRVVGKFDLRSDRDNAALEKMLKEKPDERPVPAGTNGASPPAQSQALAINGRVVDEDGKPIVGALLYDRQQHTLNKGSAPAATSDKYGRFQISNTTAPNIALGRGKRFPPRFDRGTKRILTIQAPGYAPEMVEADLSTPGKLLEITLKQGQAIQGRVIDENGKPIEEVSVSLVSWEERLGRLCLTATTDADGRFRLADAPRSDATYDFRKQGYMSVETFPMLPATQEYIVTLRPPVRVVGSIVDAETNKPPAMCRVITGVDDDDGSAPKWHEYTAKTRTDGRYEREFTQKLTSYRIRVEADGYMPAISRIFKPYDPDQGQLTYDFKLKKTSPLTKTVLGLDGSPLVNAAVVLATSPLEVDSGKASSDSLKRNRWVRTDAGGRFELPPEVEPFYLVVLHDQGYAVIDEEQFAKAPDIRIHPWADGRRKFQVERRPSPHPEHQPATDSEGDLSTNKHHSGSRLYGLPCRLA